MESSPAVGRFLAGASEGIAVGTGNYFPGAPDSDMVLAFTAHCKLVWSARLDGLTSSSPALASLSGNGKLEVVEGTDNQHGGGSVYALNGTNGAVIWRQAIDGEVIGGVVTANLGAGYQDVIVASTGGAEVLDGRTGKVLTTLERGIGLQNCALVTDDPNGTTQWGDQWDDRCHPGRLRRRKPGSGGAFPTCGLKGHERHPAGLLAYVPSRPLIER